MIKAIVEFLGDWLGALVAQFVADTQDGLVVEAQHFDHQRTLSLGLGLQRQRAMDQRRQSQAQDLRLPLPLRSRRDKGHADKQQVAAGDLQETGHLQDMQGNVHGPIGVVEDQAVVNPQSRMVGAGRPGRRRDERAVDPSRWSTTGDIA